MMSGTGDMPQKNHTKRDFPNLDWPQSLQFQTKYQQRNPVSRILTRRFLRHIVELVDELCPRDGRLLDVGCGEGINLHHIAHASTHFQLYGIDVSPESLSIARKMAHTAQLEHGSIYHLPFDPVRSARTLVEDAESGARRLLEGFRQYGWACESLEQKGIS